MATVTLEPQQGAYGGPGTPTKKYVDEQDEAVRTDARDNLARVQEALTYKLNAEEYTRAQEDIRVAQNASHELTEAISEEATARETADQAEAGVRQSADNALNQRIDTIIASSDVKDIVGTHADLENYDTSTLGDNDIIKVLSDETQNDQTTYYRWHASTSQFSLIGAEGPYYTKSAADAKFQDKLTAGANITIDVNNEISATDTTYSNFTGTDGVDPGTSGLVPAPAVGDEDKYLKADGTWDTVSAGPTIVQTTGTSTTDVMSQVATSQMIYPSGYETSKTRIAIGDGAAASGDATVAIGSGGSALGAQATANNSIAIGRNARSRGTQSVAIGNSASVSTTYAIALGQGSTAGRNYELSIGSSGTTRYIANVTDPQLAQDAATKNYVDTAIAGAAVNTISSTDWSNLWQ